MKKAIFEKFRESIVSILPLTLLVVVLSLIFLWTGVTEFTAGEDVFIINGYSIGLFGGGAVLLIIGMALFALGSDIAMSPIGDSVGSMIAKIKTKKKSTRILIALAVSFVIGMVITIAEPDLQVLAEQTGSPALVYIVAAGVGLFLAIAVMRIFFKWKLRTLLIIFYVAIFGLAIGLQFVNLEFLAISFDSGGVTTGPITVPFLLAFGLGLATAKSSKNSEDDSFGTVALCSVGPILAVVIMGFFLPQGSLQSEAFAGAPQSVGEIFARFGAGLVGHVGEHGYEMGYLLKVLIALAPILGVFFLFQFISLKLPKSQIIKIMVGILYTYVGLVIFLTGVDVGFLPLGKILGAVIAAQEYRWVLIPLGVVMGALVVLAEPAIHVLNKQVEQVTGGAISKKLMMISLCIGVSAAVGLAMVRVVTGVSIWWFIVPVYVISLALMFLVPPVFTGIAFDSGGVASGPMTATFMLPFAVGASEVMTFLDPAKHHVFLDAFGLVAFVAMAPLITIQLVGVIFKLKTKRLSKKSLHDAISAGARGLAAGHHHHHHHHKDETVELTIATETNDDGIIDFDAIAEVKAPAAIEPETPAAAENETPEVKKAEKPKKEKKKKEADGHADGH